jgi:hypothetical protein
MAPAGRAPHAGDSKMPRKYEAMRDKFKSKGEGDKDAKARAARIYSAQRKKGQKPVARKGRSGK